MSYRKSQVFEPPGKIGRKTGFHLTKTPKKNANGLEDLNDFFLSDEEYTSPNGKLLNRSPNRRLSQRYDASKSLPQSQVSPRRSLVGDKPGSPIAKTTTKIDVPVSNNSDQEGDFAEDSGYAEEMIKSATFSPIKRTTLNGSPMRNVKATSNGRSPKSASKSAGLGPSPIKKSRRLSAFEALNSENYKEKAKTLRQQKERSSSNHKSASITKSIALNKDGKKKTFQIPKVLNDEEDDENEVQDVSSSEEEPIETGPSKSEPLFLVESESSEEDSDDSIVEETSPVTKSKEQVAQAKSKPTAISKAAPKPKSTSKPRETTPAEGSSLRRSSRTKVAPVAWWRSEKVIYETTTENGAYVKQIKDVVHKPELSEVRRKRTFSFSPLPNRPSNIKPKRKKARPSSPLPTPAVNDDNYGNYDNNDNNDNNDNDAVDVPDVPDSPDSPHSPAAASNGTSKASTTTEVTKPIEESIEGIETAEWMKSGSHTIPVFEGPNSGVLIERIVAWAPNKSKNVSVIKNNDEFFKISTLFDQDSEFSGGGIIEIPAGSRKTVKSNDDTYFIFYVIQGLLEVTLSHNQFMVKTGCSFEIPMGNFYQFDNKGKNEVKLFFVQSKYVLVGLPDDEDDDDDDEDDDLEDEDD